MGAFLAVFRETFARSRRSHMVLALLSLGAAAGWIASATDVLGLSRGWERLRVLVLATAESTACVAAAWIAARSAAEDRHSSVGQSISCTGPGPRRVWFLRCVSATIVATAIGMLASLVPALDDRNSMRSAIHMYTTSIVVPSLLLVTLGTAVIAGAAGAAWGTTIGVLFSLAAFVAGRIGSLPAPLRALLPSPMSDSPDVSRVAVALCAVLGVSLLGSAAAGRESSP